MDPFCCFAQMWWLSVWWLYHSIRLSRVRLKLRSLASNRTWSLNAWFKVWPGSQCAFGRLYGINEWQRTFVRERQSNHWPGEMGLGCEVASARQRGQQDWIWWSLLLSGRLCEISFAGFQLARSGTFQTQSRIPKFRTETKLRGLPNFWSCSFQGQSYYKIAQSHRT